MAEEDIFKHMQKVKKDMDSVFENFFIKPKMLALPTMQKHLQEFKEPLSEITVIDNSGDYSTLLPELSDGQFCQIGSIISRIVHKGSKVFARLEMPGIEKEEITMNVTPAYLEVKAEEEKETKEEKKGFARQERACIGFYRKLPLPMPVKPELAESHFRNSVLEISMPKIEKKRLARVK